MYVLCILTLLLSMSQQRAHDPIAKNNNTQKPHSESKNQQASSSENGVSANYQIHEPQKKTQQEQDADASDRSFQHWYWGATILGVAVSIGLLFALIHQNKLTRKSAKAARKSAKAARASADALVNAERPFVFQKVCKIESGTFALDFVNKGKTPAQILDINVFGKSLPFGEELPVPPRYGEEMTYQQIRFMVPDDPPYRFPGYSVDMSRSFTEAKRKQFESGEHRYVVYGRVKYTDPFDSKVIHESRFCYSYNWQTDELLPYGPPEYTQYT